MIHLRPKANDATFLLKTLQWLPISFRTKAKVLTMAYKIFRNLPPPSSPRPHYFFDIHFIFLSLTHCFSHTGHLAISIYRNVPGKLLSQNLCSFVPLAGNALVPDTCLAPSYTSFRSFRKCHLLSEASVTLLFKIDLLLYLILFHSTCHHLIFYLFYLCLFMFCFPPLECKLHASRTFVCLPCAYYSAWHTVVGTQIFVEWVDICISWSKRLDTILLFHLTRLSWFHKRHPPYLGQNFQASF